MSYSTKYYKDPSFVPRIGDFLKIEQLQTGVKDKIIVRKKDSKYVVYDVKGCQPIPLRYYKIKKIGKYRIKRCKCCKRILNIKRLKGEKYVS